MAKKGGLGRDPFKKDNGLGWIGGSATAHVKQEEPEKAWGTGGTSEEGLPDEWKRHAFHVRKRFVKQLKLRATLENKDIKEVLDDALRQYLD